MFDFTPKGIIGALNYLAGEGMNTVYSVTMNVGGDGREIYPWTSYEERARYDVSKLAQWQRALAYADSLGLRLHFKQVFDLSFFIYL